MTELKDKIWLERLSKIDYAYQPIVNIHTGNAFGFEALLRNHLEAGFDSIDQVFDQAYEQGLLHQVDMFLRYKAFAKFAPFKQKQRIKLFYNIDSRLFQSQDYSRGNTTEILRKNGYDIEDICFEISEKYQFRQDIDITRLLKQYRHQGYKIAVDDCGTGFSGLQLLYYLEPDYVKIDRFFIKNLENDPKKRLVVSTIVNLTHFMGSLVLAEGVETREEYTLCREIGCDMVQGYFVQHPSRNLVDLKSNYNDIRDLARIDRRNGPIKDRSLIASEIKYIQPVFCDCDSITLFDKFRSEEETSFFPVINRHEEPIGVVRDTSFKDYIFSKFGRQLLENPTFGKDISKFITKVPIADIHSSVEKLIETYTHYNNNEGLIIVDDMKYVGLLSTKSLLKLINEKNITIARNQNPLTRLPGNTMIHEYFSESLADVNNGFHLIYFDFDNFKPYNDRYGFRNGDRLILMFADLLKKAAFSDNRFAGHVGGDDFFLGIKGETHKTVEDEMRAVSLKFKKNAESFYDPKTMKDGFMISKNREGIESRIPLMTVSIAILELPAGVQRNCSIEDAGNIIAQLKKEAKHSETGLAVANIMDFLAPETCRPFLSHREFIFKNRLTFVS